MKHTRGLVRFKSALQDHSLNVQESRGVVIEFKQRDGVWQLSLSDDEGMVLSYWVVRPEQETPTIVEFDARYGDA